MFFVTKPTTIRACIHENNSRNELNEKKIYIYITINMFTNRGHNLIMVSDTVGTAYDIIRGS